MLKWGLRPSRPVAFSGSEGRVPDRSIAIAEMIRETEKEKDDEMVRKSQKNGRKNTSLIP